uniref:Uncharacterized protein n=1 Tax=Arundo donax TaxID=35708 RepID=A0A0A9FAU5_ARUDO
MQPRMRLSATTNEHVSSN